MSSRNLPSHLRLCATLLITLTLGLPALADEPYIAEVTHTSTEVNVRSGPSTNFYVVVRLNPGERVTVYAEENGWSAIAPPTGCYSLVSEHYVDVGANGEGVINGTAVRVRAGSDLDEHRYAVQTKLDKGAEVRVLGKAGDGFLKIAPPADARLWISSDYLLRVPPDRLGNDRPATATTAQTAARRSTSPTADGVNRPGPSAVRPPRGDSDSAKVPTPMAGPQGALVAGSEGTLPDQDGAPGVVRREPPVTAEPAPLAATDVADTSTSAAPTVDYRGQLQEIEKRFKEEMAKPLGDRRMADLIDAYRPLTEQQTDELARMYAERRIAQLTLNIEASQAIRDIRNLADGVEKDRKEALDARATIRPPARPITRGFDAKGELRQSMIYASPVGPRRYRLVDPDLVVPRTLCYIEIAPDVTLDMNNFLGRMVGVRARERFVETGDVDPIPILVAEELIVLERPDAEADESAAGEVPVAAKRPAEFTTVIETDDGLTWTSSVDTPAATR